MYVVRRVYEVAVVYTVESKEAVLRVKSLSKSEFVRLADYAPLRACQHLLGVEVRQTVEEVRT